MARGVAASPATLCIPKVSFVRVEDDGSTQPAGVHDIQARSYGYNDFSDFRRPDHYIRHIEPLESELAIQVEYDMDEQDQEWLDALNAERKKEQLGKISYETFEIVMDRLEKEWFDLTKNIPKPDLAMPSEDSTCAICDDSEGENSNAIVFCDGCNLAVHQDCYGVPYIPEGQWLCRKCTVSPENPVSCILCPNEGGAFKQTKLGEWVHLLCAIWVPETRVANEVFMEPISGVEKISKQRWKLKCSICDIREGACIQCAKTSCFLAFHATCARKEKLLLPMKSTQGTEPVTLTCYCEKHLPKEQYQARVAALAAEGGGPTHNDSSTKLSKSARAYAKTYKPGPPLVPSLIVDRIMNYIGKVIIRKKADFVLLMCKYWSLKREARRGAPLLKRLHLEPWTASAGLKVQTDEEKTMKLELLRRLRNDLESVKVLAELTRKRESRKWRQAELIQSVLSKSLFPHENSLRGAFERIVANDRHDYFKNPVSKTEVPDYFDIVKHPMCWSIIDRKLDRHEYWDIQAFKNDIMLVLDNAMLYNKSGTPFYKMAQRTKTAAQSILEELNELSSSAALRSGDVDGNFNTDDTDMPSIGDLEPPLSILNLLVSADAIKDDVDLVLETDPLSSLFNYELGIPKPPPPPPPPRPPKSTKSHRKVTQDRQRPRKESEVNGTDTIVTVDTSPGFRAPKTRRAVAAAAAFEAEAEANGKPEDDRPVPSTSKKGKGKRVSVASPHAEVPPMVQHVDNQGLFMMFEKGWIFPPQQRRGGRAPVDRQALPPPKKKIRLDQETSHLSPGEDTSKQEDAMDVDVEPEQPSQGPPVSVTGAAESKRIHEEVQTTIGVVHQPDGTIIIEELDTPAIRREKTLRRKAEKLRLAAESAVPAQSSSAGKLRLGEANEGDSELSDLSDLESETGKNAQGSSYPAPAPRPEPPAPGFLRPEDLEGGTLVWAKAATYPWWPAVVFEEDDVAVPPNVLAQGRSQRQKRADRLYLVRFYDKSSSWQWLDTTKLKALGEDKKLDEELLGPNSKLQRWKNAVARTDCRAAFRRAVAEMETANDATDIVVEGDSSGGGVSGGGIVEEDTSMRDISGGDIGGGGITEGDISRGDIGGGDAPAIEAQ